MMTRMMMAMMMSSQDGNEDDGFNGDGDDVGSRW